MKLNISQSLQAIAGIHGIKFRLVSALAKVEEQKQILQILGSEIEEIAGASDSAFRRSAIPATCRGRRLTMPCQSPTPAKSRSCFQATCEGTNDEPPFATAPLHSGPEGGPPRQTPPL